MHIKSSPVFGKNKVILRSTQRPVTPFGGLCVFFEFLHKIDFADAVNRFMPIKTVSPNAIEPSRIFASFLVSVVAGARRFAHTSIVRSDAVLLAMMGVNRFPCDDTIRNFFMKFGMGETQKFFEPLWRWMVKRVAIRAEGYSLDLDSTVFERYGKQEGALKGHNPKKHGRPSHHPILAVLAEAYFVLHAWMRSGNAGTARGVVEFLKETLALLPDGVFIRCLRADSGFFDNRLMGFLEERGLPYIVVARMTKTIKMKASGVKNWVRIDADYSVGEFRAKLHGWSVDRRFIVIRERIRESGSAVGRRLFDIPGYTFRVMVTSMSGEPSEIWRDYNKRGDMENRIKELKYDLAADDFCMRQFYATEAAFRSVLALFNLLGEFQRASGMGKWRQPATLRTEVFLCGAILGRKGHDLVVHLSESWGGLSRRNPLLEKVKAYIFPTSPKLDATPEIPAYAVA